MKIRIFLVSIICCAMAYEPIAGQGRILLLNGKEKRFSTAEVKGEVIEYQPEGSSKPKLRKIDKFDVFSIIRDQAGEEVIYNPDTVTGEDPTVAEVRDYIKGEKYAGLVYRKPLNLISGIAVGAAGSPLAFYGLPIPVVYPAILGRFTPKVKEPITYMYEESSGTYTGLSTPDAVSNIKITEAFAAGYGKKARNMKIKNSLIGGGIGFTLGIAALIILGNN